MIETISDFRNENLIFNHLIHKNPGKGIFSMEAHNSWEFLYVVDGDVTYVIEDRRYKLKRGDLLITRPARYHYIEIDSPKDYERIDILFDERILLVNNTAAVSEELEVINLSSSKRVYDVFGKLEYYYSKLEKEEFTKAAALVLSELFYELSIAEKNIDEIKYSTATPLVSNALKYISDNLFTIKNIGEISRELFVTDSYLYRIFKKELKQTPKKYINDKRLLAAQNMISMGEKPTSVCEKCGFSDYTSFYRSYSSFFGYSPSKEHVFK